MGSVISIIDRALKTTNDQAYTAKDLRLEVYRIAEDINLGPTMALIVISSFTDCGLIETYDDLGYYEMWEKMIQDMLETAWRER